MKRAEKRIDCIGKYIVIAAVILVFPSTACSQMTFTYLSPESLGTQGRALADISGDNFIDLIIVDGELVTIFAWYKYPAWTKYPVNDAAVADFDYIPDATVSDIDKDKDMDIIILDSQNGGNKNLYWFENPRPVGNPETTPFPKHTIWSASSEHMKDVSVEDFDGDGKSDIAVRFEETKLMIFFQDTPDSWTSRTESIHRHEGMATGDINGDYKPDIVYNGTWLKNPGDRISTWVSSDIDPKWFGQGSGWQDDACRVAVADIDGDRRKDPILSHSEKPGYPVSWYSSLSPDTGPWTEHVIGYVDYCHSLQAGDVDNDGDTDVLAATLPTASVNEVVIFINTDGHGGAWTPQRVDTKSSYIAKWADIGNDGDLDILGSRNWSYGPADLWINNLDPGPDIPLDTWILLLVILPVLTVYYCLFGSCGR